MIQNTNLTEQYEPPSESSGMCVPLIMLPEGVQATVVQIRGGRGLCRRLAELGFNAGEMVRVIKNHRPGPVMVEVRDSRVALGRGVTMKILVEEVE